MDFSKIFPEKIHHAYIIENNNDLIVDDILNYFDKTNFVNKKSLDVFFGKFETFSIEDSLSIRDWYKNKSINEGNKVCVIYASFLSREAQESLLKILEEPTPSNYFIIITPNVSTVIPTLMSRVHYLCLSENQSKEDVLSFVEMSLKERFDFIASFIKENKKEDDSGYLRDRAISFMNELERYYYKEFKEDKKIDRTRILNEILINKNYLNTPGASVKMVLENISILIN